MKVLYGTDSETGILEVRPEGRLDAVGAETFWDDVTRKLDEGYSRVLLDISQISIMTSAGVAILIRLLTRLENSTGALAVWGGTGRVLSVLETVRIGPLIHLCETEAEARRALTASRD